MHSGVDKVLNTHKVFSTVRFSSENVQTILPIMFPSLYKNSRTHWNKLKFLSILNYKETFYRTIHGLIYNALKLFMEEDQKLFDLCVQNYNKQKEMEQQKQEDKQKQWAELEKAANQNAREILPENDIEIGLSDGS